MLRMVYAREAVSPQTLALENMCILVGVDFGTDWFVQYLHACYSPGWIMVVRAGIGGVLNAFSKES